MCPGKLLHSLRMPYIISKACVGMQVLPNGLNSMGWPFFALLGALLTPGLVACAVDTWTKLSCIFEDSVCWTIYVLLAVVVYTPSNYLLWHLLFMVTYTVSSVFYMCFSRSATQQDAVGACGYFEHPVKHVALLSAVMAVTEDLVFMGVASMLYLVNRQSTGTVVSTPAYCVSMLLSCMHVLMEAWGHCPGIRQAFGGCLADVCCLQQ
jgi:hypothetical protein